MKIIAISHAKKQFYAYRATIQIMKTITVLLLISALCMSAIGYGQKINLSFKNAKIEKVLKEVRNQTGVDFLYSNQELDRAQPISINIHNKTLDEVLKLCFVGQPFTYTISGKSVVIRGLGNKEEKAPQIQQQRPIKGKVTNSEGEALKGITVTIKGSNLKVLTDENGEFELKTTTSKNTLIFQ